MKAHKWRRCGAGEQYFFLDGRWQICKKCWGVVGTVFMILVPEALFLALVAPSLDSAALQGAAAACGVALTATTVALLLRTCAMDPGMLPLLQPDSQYQRMEKPRSKEVVIQGATMTLRYDETYHFYRPPRAHHCSDSHAVIEKFDHFCPWVGQAIGVRNYRAFVSFLLACMLLLLSTIAFCVALIVQDSKRLGADGKDSNMFDVLRHAWHAAVLVLYCCCFALAVGGILGFHLYLIAVGQTTYENQKQLAPVFSDGILMNCHSVWCLPVPEPFVDFTQRLEDAQRQEPPALVRMWNPPWCEQA